MEEINLRDLLIYFRKHLLLFFAMVILCVSAGSAYIVLVQKPEYKSRATIILSSDKSKTTVQSEITANKNLIETYTEVVKSHRVLDRVIEENNLKESYEALSAKINVSSLKKRRLLVFQWWMRMLIEVMRLRTGWRIFLRKKFRRFTMIQA